MNDNCKNCGNTKLDFVLYTMSNNAKRVRKQCLKCGCSDSRGYKHDLFKSIFTLPIYDVELYRQFLKTQSKNRESRLDMGTKSYYNEVYLKSDEWKSKRENILLRDKYNCVCCKGKATQVHHINYNNVYQEKDRQLVSVCKDCHEKIHSTTPIYMGGLFANFGILGLCHNCQQYHENGKTNLCNNCKK